MPTRFIPDDGPDHTARFVLLVIATVIVIGIAILTLSWRVIAGLPIPAIDIASGLIGIWAIFLMVAGRRWVDITSVLPDDDDSNTTTNQDNEPESPF